MTSAGLILKNLTRRKTRTTLTVLSIFIALLLFGLLSAVKWAFTAGVAVAGADRLVVRNKVSLIMDLPESYTARLEKIPGVSKVCYWTWFNGMYRDSGGHGAQDFFASFPVDPARLTAFHNEYRIAPDHMAEWLNKKNGAVVGVDLAKRHGWKIGDRVPLTSPIWRNKSDGAWEFEIVGLYEAGKEAADTTSFFFRHDFFHEGRAYGEGTIGWFTVQVSDPKRSAEIARAIDAEFENSPYETKAEPEGAFAQAFVNQMGNIGFMMTAIMSAVFFTILLIAGNTMAQAVRERTEELGVLKALGFSNQRVLSLVLIESCVIAVFGGLPGLVVAYLITARGSPVPQMLPVLRMPETDVLIGVGLTLALGLAAGIVPAIQAMRLSIAQALRRNV